jgi:glycosyltransferase involved in cell wall biosynthesis
LLPRISIVTPSFNQGQFIEETICSVLDQNYGNLEYIIIDGGSSDETVQVIKKYEKFLKYWVSEGDQGQSHAINKGLLHCTGEIFNWLNSDDLLAPDALSAIAERFVDPEIDIVSGKEIHFDGSSEKLREGTILYPDLAQNLLNGVIYQPSTFWRFSALKPLLPVNETLHYLMDTQLWVNYIMNNGISKVKKIDKVLAKFRLHKDSKTVGLSEQFVKERWQLRWGILKEIDPEFHAFDNFLSRKASRTAKLELGLSREQVDKNSIKNLMAEELCYELYRDFSYHEVKELLRVSFKSGVVTRRLLKYFLLLWIIPRQILHLLRNGKA